MRPVVFAAHAASAARPLSVTIRIGWFACVTPASTKSNGPTPNATRYEGSGLVVPNSTRLRSVPSAVSFAMLVFETAISARGTSSVSCHGTLLSGSSMHGNARRAYVDSNCV